jgi:hypothetical protein
VNLKNGRQQSFSDSRGGNLWAPSVLRDGTAYFLATGERCGSHPRLVRYLPDEIYGYVENGVVAKLPTGVDSAISLSYLDKKGKANVIFERAHCSDLAHRSDLYKVIDKVQLKVAVDGNGSVTSDPKGIDCPGHCKAWYRGGSTKVRLTATPDLGYHFDHWSGYAPCVNSPETHCKVVMNDSRSVTAHFALGPP